MRKEVEIKTDDGFTLAGIFVPSSGSKKGIVFAHGMTVDKSSEGIFVRAEPKLNELGFSTLRFDFRGHGQSSGDLTQDFTISGEMEDLKTAVKFMQDEGLEWLGLAGASFGGSIAALYAGDSPKSIQRLFLANPVLDYDKAFLHSTTAWAMKTFIKLVAGRPFVDEMQRYHPCQELKKYHSPLLIVHGDRDGKVDIKHVKNCFECLPNNQKEFIIIKGSAHGFHAEPFKSRVVDEVVNFFTK